MQETERNIYRRCRKKAANRDDRFATIESAAEVLNVCDKSLINYELFMTRPPAETVVMMADKYRTPELLPQYCATECPIGRARGVESPEGNPELCRVSIKVLSMLQQADQISKSIIDVSRDGRIDADEIEPVEQVIEWAAGLTQIIEALKQILTEEGEDE